MTRHGLVVAWILRIREHGRGCGSRAANVAGHAVAVRKPGEQAQCQARGRAKVMRRGAQFMRGAHSAPSVSKAAPASSDSRDRSTFGAVLKFPLLQVAHRKSAGDHNEAVTRLRLLHRERTQEGAQPMLLQCAFLSFGAELQRLQTVEYK